MKLPEQSVYKIMLVDDEPIHPDAPVFYRLTIPAIQNARQMIHGPTQFHGHPD